MVPRISDRKKQKIAVRKSTINFRKSCYINRNHDLRQNNSHKRLLYSNAAVRVVAR